MAESAFNGCNGFFSFTELSSKSLYDIDGDSRIFLCMQVCNKPVLNIVALYYAFANNEKPINFRNKTFTVFYRTGFITVY